MSEPQEGRRLCSTRHVPYHKDTESASSAGRGRCIPGWVLSIRPYRSSPVTSGRYHCTLCVWLGPNLYTQACAIHAGMGPALVRRFLPLASSSDWMFDDIQLEYDSNLSGCTGHLNQVVCCRRTRPSCLRADHSDFLSYMTNTAH